MILNKNPELFVVVSEQYAVANDQFVVNYNTSYEPEKGGLIHANINGWYNTVFSDKDPLFENGILKGLHAYFLGVLAEKNPNNTFESTL